MQEAVDIVEDTRLECQAVTNSEYFGSAFEASSSVDPYAAGIGCNILIHTTRTVFCPSGFGFREESRTNEELVCKASQVFFNSEQEAQDALDNLESKCFASHPNSTFDAEDVVLFFASFGEFFTFEATCEISPLEEKDVICPISELGTSFVETARSNELLNCEAFVFGESLQEAQDEVDQLQDLCLTIPNASTSETDVVESTSGQFTNYIGLVPCDISLVLEPEFGPFGDGVVIRACDATCTEEIEETRVCLNGNVGDPGCEGTTTRTVTSSCNTGSEGLCPVMSNIIVPSTIVPLILDE